MALSDGKGYLLPASLDPATDVCIRAYVPNDKLYIAAFWASYEYLCSWVAWERNSTQGGKAAAARYRSAFNLARLWYVDFPETCCDDLPEPVHSDPVSAVRSTVWALRYIIEEVNRMLKEGNTVTIVKAYLTTEIVMIPSLSDMIDSMAEETAVDRDAAIAATDWQDVYDSWWCDRSECHLENYSWYSTFTREWVVCLMRNIENWASEGASLIQDWAADFIRNTVPDGFLNLINTFPNGGANMSFTNSPCGWEHVFEWNDTENWRRWYTASFTPTRSGAFSAGTGWVGTYTEGVGLPWAFFADVWLDFPVTTVTTVAAVVHNPQAYSNLNFYVFARDTVGAWYSVGYAAMTQGEHIYTVNVNANIQGVRIAAATSVNGELPEGFQPSTLKAVTFEGLGVNPFQ